MKNRILWIGEFVREKLVFEVDQLLKEAEVWTDDRSSVSNKLKSFGESGIEMFHEKSENQWTRTWNSQITMNQNSARAILERFLDELNGFVEMNSDLNIFFVLEL